MGQFIQLKNYDSAFHEYPVYPLSLLYPRKRHNTKGNCKDKYKYNLKWNPENTKSFNNIANMWYKHSESSVILPSIIARIFTERCKFVHVTGRALCYNRGVSTVRISQRSIKLLNAFRNSNTLINSMSSLTFCFNFIILTRLGNIVNTLCSA